MMNPTVLERAYKTEDGLVPTTVFEQLADYEDGGYHSDDKGFYCPLDKHEETSPNTSGTVTPASTEDMMDTVGKFAETYWHDDFTALVSAVHMPPSVEQSQQNGEMVNAHMPTAAVADNFTYDSSRSADSSDDETDADESKPEILRRSVVGMTSEEKKLRRRELNRLAAQRSRQKKKTVAVKYEQDVKRLTKRNAELKKELTILEASKAQLYQLIKHHFKQCNNNNNHNNNTNTNTSTTQYTTTEVQSAPLKLEVPAMPYSPPKAAAATDYFNASSIFQGYSGDISGVSQGYTGAYD